MRENYDIKIAEAAELIADADRIIIGGGAGLSAAAGLVYGGKRFADNFGDFIDKYGLTDMYSAAFYPFLSSEEKWAYWAKHIYVNRLKPSATELYRNILRIVKEKEYFVITTNVDAQFFKAGFDRQRVFAVQGDYGKFQCSRACHSKTYDNEHAVLTMLAAIEDCRVPTDLVPKCPVCGADMEVNIRKDARFVQDGEWYASQRAYAAFADGAAKGKTVLLELGVGFNTPSIIRYPFERVTYDNANTRLIRVNRDYPEAFSYNAEKTLSFGSCADKVISDICNAALE